jgi:hypothetical protein
MPKPHSKPAVRDEEALVEDAKAPKPARNRRTVQPVIARGSLNETNLPARFQTTPAAGIPGRVERGKRVRGTSVVRRTR